MAYMCVRSLFVLTLLQLCRAEISDSLPESWYSANVINDGFNPKPLSEIFSTESPFSSTNPIIVLPKQSNSVPDELLLLSSLSPQRKISTTGSSIGDFSKTSLAALRSTTSLPPSIQTIPPSSLHTIPLTTYQSTQSTYQSPPTTYQSTPSTYQSTPSTYQSTPSTYQSTPSTYLTTPSTLAAFSPSTTLQTELPETSVSQSQSQPSQTQSQQIRLELVPGSQNLPERQRETSTQGPLSNYFLIYQQAPQSIREFPGPAGTSQEVPQFSTVRPGSTTREPSTVIIQPVPTVSPPSTRTAPPSSTFIPTVRVQTSSTPRPTRICQNVSKGVTTPIPRLPGKGPLQIRVVAPSGSITNVHFNSAKHPTTKRPTTTRPRKTQKPKKNNYDTCTDGCKGKREPVCAAPLSTDYLDPNTLKGFPSVCHMACHNSYKKDPYEKVLDGRCGRLRTRIRTLDSKTKLKRDELNKAQYFVDHSGTKTVVEFSGLSP